MVKINEVYYTVNYGIQKHKTFENISLLNINVETQIPILHHVLSLSYRREH